MDETFEQAVKDEAYAIWQWRMSFTPPFSGNDKSDYFNALENIRSKQRDDILSPVAYNRIKDLM